MSAALLRSARSSKRLMRKPTGIEYIKNHEQKQLTKTRPLLYGLDIRPAPGEGVKTASSIFPVREL